MGTCDLCDLPTPDPPVTDEAVPGTFCCRGCLEVARTLGRPDGLGNVDGAVGPRDALGRTDGTAVDGVEAASTETTFLAVSGMHCATCEAFLEHRGLDVEGVAAVEASYPSGLLRVRYDPDRVDRDALPDRLSGTGYRARPADVAEQHDDGADVGRLLVGGFFGMMVMVWYVIFLYPAYLGLPANYRVLDVTGGAGTYLLSTIWVMASTVLFYAGWPRLRGAYVSLRAGVPNMDLLVALAAVSAYVYSTVALLLGRTEVYFDVVVAIVVVVALGKYYEARVRRRAAGHLAALATARTETARRRTPGGTEPIAADDLEPGDEVVVSSGERVPVDGTVVDGPAAVDESLLTGEPEPRTVGSGDSVVGGSTLVDGALVVRADDAGSRVDRLLAHLWSVQSGRPGAQRLADRLAAVFVPLAVTLAVAATAWRLVGGEPPRVALLAGLAVLVVSCPCALGLATPLAVSRGVREALEAGVVVTNGTVFERGADVDIVVLDKTGTLTSGEMTLFDAVGDDAVLERAAAVEAFSGHPVAAAVVEAAEARGLAAGSATVDEFERHGGRGVSARVDGERVLVGNRELLDEVGESVPPRLEQQAAEARDRGHLPSFVAWGGEVHGLLVTGDRPRDGWREVVAEIARDRDVIVLTGDDGAQPFADHPGVSESFVGVPPEAKATVVERLRSRGTVAMVGDGTNDASALAAADVGIAVERGAALASDAADAVVVTGALDAVPGVFRLTRATRRRVRGNLAWAFGYNAVAIPAALLGLLNPLLAAAAMAASSLLVVGNSSRRLLPAVGEGSDTPTGPEPEAVEPIGTTD